MPCTEHVETLIGQPVDVYEQHLFRIPPAIGSFEDAQHARVKWGSGLLKYLACEPAHVLRQPDWWIVPYPIAFHEYKNVTLLARIYAQVHGRRARRRGESLGLRRGQFCAHWIPDRFDV